MMPRAIIILLVLTSGLWAYGCSPPKVGKTREDRDRSTHLVLGRGDLTERLLLTGELDAVSSESLAVPRTPQWNLSIRWLEADGTLVTAGQKVAEFDNSAFANNLAEQKASAAQSANDLAYQI